MSKSGLLQIWTNFLDHTTLGAYTGREEGRGGGGRGLFVIFLILPCKMSRNGLFGVLTLINSIDTKPIEVKMPRL